MQASGLMCCGLMCCGVAGCCERSPTAVAPAGTPPGYRWSRFERVNQSFVSTRPQNGCYTAYTHARCHNASAPEQGGGSTHEHEHKLYSHSLLQLAIACQHASSSLLTIQLLAAAWPPPPSAPLTAEVSNPSMLRRLTLMCVSLLGWSACCCWLVCLWLCGWWVGGECSTDVCRARWSITPPPVPSPFLLPCPHLAPAPI